MEYHEAAEFLFDLRRYPPRTGIAATRELLASLGEPQTDMAVVQIAGSNGKGSTARMTERVLREAGVDVGLYTSPHLDDIRERVQINGRTVSKAAVCEYVAAIDEYATDAAAGGASPTFFEAVTGLAIWAFDRADVDVAVLEVGIGGRYDATSAVEADTAAVTNVTLEHADILGETIPEIARDMAAIAPTDTALVTAAEGEALSTIEGAVPEIRRVGTVAGADVVVTDRGREDLEQAVRLASDEWTVDTRLPLLGGHQAVNAGVAAAVVSDLTSYLGVSLSAETLARGLRSAHWPGRFEVMAREPLIVLDGAHNPSGCAGLTRTLDSFEYQDLSVVFGAMCEKDHAEMVAALPAVDCAYTCEPDRDRAEAASALAAAFRADGRADNIDVCPDVQTAVTNALAGVDAGDAVVVTGSLYTVADARRRWTRVGVRKHVTDSHDAHAVLTAANLPPHDIPRLQEEASHRVYRTRLLPRIAHAVRADLLALGGRCAVSPLAQYDEELTDVVLMGTRRQFTQLASRLLTADDARRQIATELTTALDLPTPGSTEASSDGRPVHGARGGSMPASTPTRPAGGRDGVYPWDDGTAVMGILNVTPDSFYDGGRYQTTEDAIAQAGQLAAEGADIIDVGGESTRPGADPVAVEDEQSRVLPVIESLADRDVHVSVDTRKAEVARAALDAGADILNDVSGLADPEMRYLAADYDVPVVVMHSINTPVDPDVAVEYDDVVADILDALVDRILLAEKAGVSRSQIIIDPGLGFGKTAAESFELLDRLDEFHALGCPVMVGHSRKSMFTALPRDGSDDRLAATVAASALAVDRGVDIIRVHDVSENIAAVATVAATKHTDQGPEL